MDDLYRFVNGPWLDTHVIPNDRGVDGTFHKLRDEAEEHVHAIVETDQGRVGKLYASFMDVEGVNAAGMQPLNADLELIDASSPSAFARSLGELELVGIGAPLSFFVEKDSGSEETIAYLVQSGLGLPDEAYYREESHAETLAAYREHVGTMLHHLDATWLGTLSPEDAAARIVDFEKTIAAGHWDVVRSRDAVATYNRVELTELPDIIVEMLTAAHLPQGPVVNMMPSYVEHLAGLFTAEHLEDWRLWALWTVLRSRAGLLPEEVGRANFAFYGTHLSGATQQRERFKRGVALTESLVGHEIGRAYVDEHFPPESKEQMLELVGYLQRAYHERIQALEWMTEETKQRALEKLSKFKAKIGYPDVWRTYVGLEFGAAGSDLLTNVRAGSRYEHDYQLSKLGKPADRSEWFSTPQTVNAFYNPVVNDITFPAAILRPPFFDAQADAAENFGAIGAVIGHEIGHGFDDQGSRYDGEGNLNSWWSDADREAFGELTAKLVKQFDGLVPKVLAGTDSRGVNGEFTLGENIGDLGGLGIAVYAYSLYVADNGEDEAREFSVEGASEELRGAYTGLQRLFLAWARVWRTAIRPEMAQQYLAIDPHSPAEFRCNQIAANIDEFYEAFDVDESSPMFVAPEDRVTIW